MKLINITITSEWLDEATGEIITDVRKLGEESKATPKKKSSTKIVQDDGTPKLTLEDTKYTLSSTAVAMLGVEPGDTVDIKYRKVEGSRIMMPIIGASKSFGTKAGNKLTQKNTVRFSGKANVELAAYGDSFVLEDIGEEGLFHLKGNKTIEDAQPAMAPAETTDIDDLIEGADDVKQVTNLDFNFE